MKILAATPIRALAAATILLTTACSSQQKQPAHEAQAAAETPYYDTYRHHGNSMNAKRMPSAAKKGSFACSNAPATKWGTYFCAYGTFVGSKQLGDVVFGTCEGSSKAEEEEPVDQVELGTLKHDPKLAGTSREWKEASAFNVTTKEHGPATLLIQPSMFDGTNQSDRAEARLKITVEGQKKDIRLTCGSSLD